MPKLTKKAYARRKLILKWRRFLGLCVGCSAEANGYSMCDRCQTKATARNKAKRENNKKKNICQECGNNKVNSGCYRCDWCIELMRARKPDRVCNTESCLNKPDLYKMYCNECCDRRDAEKQSCNVHFLKCKVCNSVFTSSVINREYCSSVCSQAANYYGKDVAPIQRKCKQCGLLFNTYDKNKQRVFCSTKCSNRAGSRQGKHIRRARMRGAFIEIVNIGALYERDNNRCQLCGRKLNLKRKVPHKLAATIDHIIPIANGGDHSYMNTQLACFRCNSLKGNRSVDGGEQLFLFG